MGDSFHLVSLRGLEHASAHLLKPRTCHGRLLLPRGQQELRAAPGFTGSIEKGKARTQLVGILDEEGRKGRSGLASTQLLTM